MRTRLIVSLAILLLTAALTMGLAAAGAPPYPPDVHGGGGSGDGTEQVREGEPADANCVLPILQQTVRLVCP